LTGSSSGTWQDKIIAAGSAGITCNGGQVGHDRGNEFISETTGLESKVSRS
jgi:hypothetical protein